MITTAGLIEMLRSVDPDGRMEVKFETQLPMSDQQKVGDVLVYSVQPDPYIKVVRVVGWKDRVKK